MPIYEYLCMDCREKFEVLRPMSEADATTACSKCGYLNTSRVITVFYAQSSGRVIAGGGGSSGCSSCRSGACASCGIR